MKYEKMIAPIREFLLPVTAALLTVMTISSYLLAGGRSIVVVIGILCGMVVNVIGAYRKGCADGRREGFLEGIRESTRIVRGYISKQEGD